MIWRRVIGFVALFVLLRILGQLFGQISDTLFVGGIVVLFVAGILYERSSWSHLLDRLGRGSDDERREILQGLFAEDPARAWYAAREMGLEAPTLVPQAAIFDYPAGSRFVITVLSWLFTVFAAGFLWAVIRHGGEDPANGWVLFTLGLCGLGAAARFHARSQWLGRQIIVDEDGIREVLDDQVTTAIEWNRLARIRLRRLGGIEFYTVDRDRLVVRQDLLLYGTFIMLLKVWLQALR